MYTSQVDHWHNFLENGLKSSMEIANLKFQSSFVKSNHVSCPCFAIYNMAHQPSMLLVSTCNYSNCDMVQD
jgi:hypothetical protein